MKDLTKTILLAAFNGACGALTYAIVVSKERTWYIHEWDDNALIAILRRHGIYPVWYNCGWAKAEDVECFKFICSNKAYAKICEEVNAKGIEIMQDNVGF